MTIRASEDSHQLTISVRGKDAELTVTNGRAVLLKLREALRISTGRP